MNRWILAAAAMLLGLTGQALRGPAAAQEDHGNGLAVVLSASRYAVNPGHEVGLAAGLQNRGRETIRLRLTCAPPVDYEVRDSNGVVVWQQGSDCGSDDLEITIAPGQTRWWEAPVWPGADDLGTYYAYATFKLFPREAVAGPVSILVAEGDHEPPPRETDHPRPTEHPRETDGPHPTEHPRETDAPHPTEQPREFPGEPFPVADWEGAQTHPDVDGRREAGDCQSLVVWYDTHTHGVVGRFIEAGWHSDDFLISGDHTAAGPPRVAYNAVRRLWLVVWTGEGEGDDLQIHGRYVVCGQGATEGPVFAIGSHEHDDHSPTVAATGEHFAVAWVRDGENHSQIRGARIVGTDSPQQIGLAEGAVSEPTLACRPHAQCFVVWTRGEGAARDLIGRRWWPGEERADELLNVATGDAAEYDASIAAGDGDLPYLVTYTRTGDASAVYGRRVHASGEMLVGDAAKLSGEDGAHSSDVSPASHGWNVVWVEGNVMPAVRGRFVGNGDALQLGDSVAISPPGAPADGHPAAAQVGNWVALAVWDSVGPDNPGDIWGRFVGLSGGGAGRVVLLGRVESAGGMLVAGEAGVLDIAVERVLEGAFACTEARVYYAADTVLPPDVSSGVRLYIIGEVAGGQGPCALDVEAPGTLIAAAGPERLFAPALHTR
jgi:hypothetical protein